MAVNPVADEGVLPVGTPMATTSIAQFIRCNPRLGTMRAKRDSNGMEKRTASVDTYVSLTWPVPCLAVALTWT